MKRRISPGTIAALIVVVAIVIDQVIKILVKTNFYYGEELRITSWMRLLFIENNGMAFGMELGSKLFLSLFRIVVVGFLLCYLWRIRHNTTLRTGYVVCVSLVTAGALGNVIDGVFYGQLFNSPTPPMVAEMFPADGGYAPLLSGKVVDMFYFPLCEWDWPQWMPVVGGTHFVFFQPIFNFADACLSVGVIALILFYNKELVLDKQQPAAGSGQGDAHEAGAQ